MAQDISTGYGSRLKQLLDHLGWPASKFAEVAGITGPTLSAILKEETKNPGINIFVNLSKTTKVNLQWLATGEGEMFNSTKKSTQTNEEEFDQIVFDQMQSRINELKEMLETQRYTIQLQKHLLEGKSMGDTVGPLWREGVIFSLN
ncbi:helix-turn-helix domain-containing protein [Larkinella soli]|uniref:helix-turn-helix domain-containing protein n=1 Tax=Larkinella soli TaxID=1770527 RepID=UPI000FFC62B8|nr:helix-turn-helix transcriptional regulator [Larkinella soli]